MKKLMTALVVGVLATAAPVLAGSLMKTQISGTANWVVHLDYEGFNASRIGQLIREELKAQGIEAQLENFTTVFGFHPLNDVRDVTLYGQGKQPEKAVVLIDGNFNKETLLALVRMNPMYEETEHNGVPIHRWLHEENKAGQHKEQMMYGCLYNDKLVVISTGLEAVKGAVDVLKGQMTNATAGAVFGQSILETTGAFLLAAASGVSQMVGEEPKAAALRQTDELSLAIGEADGNFYVDLGLKAKTEEAATNISKVLNGIIAFMSMAGEEQPKLAELAQKLQLSCTNSTVQIHFGADSKSVFDFFKEQWEKNKQADQQTQ